MKREGSRLFALLVVGAAFADDWAAPQPSIHASESGRTGFKVLDPAPDSSRSRGMLFRLDDLGLERIVWQGPLVNVPARVFISPDGRNVITIDTYGPGGHDHSLVLYGHQGTVLKDCKLEDLLTSEEIRTKVTHTVSSRRWRDRAEFRFHGLSFVVRLEWGRVFRVDLSTGKLEDGEPE